MKISIDFGRVDKGSTECMAFVNVLITSDFWQLTQEHAHYLTSLPIPGQQSHLAISLLVVRTTIMRKFLQRIRDDASIMFRYNWTLLTCGYVTNVPCMFLSIVSQLLEITLAENQCLLFDSSQVKETDSLQTVQRRYTGRGVCHHTICPRNMLYIWCKVRILFHLRDSEEDYFLKTSSDRR